jgi:flagellar hook assembly protein FlgD
MNNLNNQVWAQMNEIKNYENMNKELEKILEAYENMLNVAIDKKRIEEHINFYKDAIETNELIIKDKKLLIDIEKERMSEL